MRDVSTDFKTDVNSQQISTVFFTLLTLNYSGATPLYIVNNHESVTSNGHVFLPFAFRFTMPQDGEGRRSAKLVIDNVDRSMTTFILDAGLVDLTVTEQLVRSSALDTAEIERSYVLRDVTITRKVISGELIYQQYLHDAFPKLVKTPALFPGVF